MLLIGIDEAGYGPRLGPLCHGYAAFRFAGEAESERAFEWPDLWKRLRPAVAKAGSRARADAVRVDDSKLLYAPKIGYALLEKSVHAFLTCESARTCPARLTLDDLLPADDRSDLDEDAWHVPHAQPTAQTPGTHSSLLRKTLEKCGIQVAAFGARATSPRRFNDSLTRGLNKADASWSIIVTILRSLLAAAIADKLIAVAIDCQGGRRHYAALLAEALNTALIQPLGEDSREALYRLDCDGRTIIVGFFVEGDGRHLPIALASMAAKLTREKCMERLNAYFRTHQPDLRPTAGYYNDAQRFLDDTAALRQRLNVRDDHFIRQR